MKCWEYKSLIFFSFIKIPRWNTGSCLTNAYQAVCNRQEDIKIGGKIVVLEWSYKAKHNCHLLAGSGQVDESAGTGFGQLHLRVTIPSKAYIMYYVYYILCILYIMYIMNGIWNAWDNFNHIRTRIASWFTDTPKCSISIYTASIGQIHMCNCKSKILYCT